MNTKTVQNWNILPIMDSVSSTNTWLKEHADQLSDSTVLIAREQTKGRGRSERRFHSAKGKGLYLSVLLKHTPASFAFTRMTALSALAVQKAIWECCQLNTQIKWVNDIIYQGHKLAGILCEALYEGTKLKAFIIGIGINVYSQSFPAMDNQPGAIEDYALFPPSIDALTLTLLQQLQACLQAKNEKQLLTDYRQHSCILHKPILVKDGRARYEAYACDIDEDYALIIETKGKKKKLQSGEISIRISSNDDKMP